MRDNGCLFSSALLYWMEEEFKTPGEVSTTLEQAFDELHTNS